MSTPSLRTSPVSGLLLSVSHAFPREENKNLLYFMNAQLADSEPGSQVPEPARQQCNIAVYPQQSYTATHSQYTTSIYFEVCMYVNRRIKIIRDQ